MQMEKLLRGVKEFGETNLFRANAPVPYSAVRTNS